MEGSIPSRAMVFEKEMENQMPLAVPFVRDKCSTLLLMREALRELADLRIKTENSDTAETLYLLQLKAERALAHDDLDRSEQ